MSDPADKDRLIAELLAALEDALEYVKTCTNAVGNYPSDVKASIDKAEEVIKKARGE